MKSPTWVDQRNRGDGRVIEDLNNLDEHFYAESSEYLQKAITPYLMKCFLEINEIAEQVPLVSQMFLDEDPTAEDLFHCAPSEQTWISDG